MTTCIAIFSDLRGNSGAIVIETGGAAHGFLSINLLTIIDLYSTLRANEGVLCDRNPRSIDDSHRGAAVLRPAWDAHGG
jgi:hypothetical protein